jgi:hypothetical protein
MKKYIFILIILITSKVVSQSSFPSSNAIWNENHINSIGDPIDEILYGIKGDTLINDTLYNKLYMLSDTILSDASLQDYIGGFRQEGQKVWFKPSYWSYQDILLYDFSASIGDTVWHKAHLHLSNNAENTHEFILSKNFDVIQDITIENGIKKYTLLALEPFPDEWFFEFGSIRGLFGSIIDYPLTGDSFNLACFKHNDTVIYNNNLECNKCFCTGPTGVDEKNINTNWVKVFPNPVQGSLTINIDKPYSKIRVEIIDENGHIVYKKESLDSPITLKDSAHGIHFIKLMIDNEVITKKIIIE